MNPTIYKKKVKCKDGTIKVYEYKKCYDKKINCGCGSTYLMAHRARHLRTKKHNIMIIFKFKKV